MDMNFLTAVLITGVIALVIVALTFIFKENKKIKEVTDILLQFAPGLMDTIESVLDVVNPSASAKFDEIERLVIIAVNAVEQLSKGTEMTSQEKKELAMQYFQELAEDLGLPELTELQMRTLDIIIENVVIQMNSSLGKL